MRRAYVLFGCDMSNSSIVQTKIFESLACFFGGGLSKLLQGEDDDYNDFGSLLFF